MEIFMETGNLKKGLFGYTQDSVQKFISSINEEFKQKTLEIKNENSNLHKECEELKKEIISLKETITHEKQSSAELTGENENLQNCIYDLSSKLESALADETDYKKNSQEVTAVMLEAKRFADGMKKKALDEYAEQKNQNAKKIEAENIKINGYIKDIDNISAALQVLCKKLDNEITVKKNELEAAKNELDKVQNGHFSLHTREA